MSTPDPLALETGWSCEVPLISFEEALELTVFRSGLTRADWLKRLAHQLHRPQLLPLLWLLPRGWKLAPAELPEQLQTLGGLLERSLLTPGLLAALADDLPHLLRAATTAQPTASDLWHGGDGTSLPESLEQLLRRSGPSSPTPGDLPAASITSIKTDAVEDQALSGGLIWRNTGLSHGQSDAERRRNGRAAQVLNRLGANLQYPDDPWRFEQCVSSSRWISSLVETGWQITAQLRCSVASFGLGASLPRASGGWSQVPIALPIRTGLLGPQGLELQSLLPHSCLELELRREEELILLQYYQGTEGFCGWEGLNDLDRPWQNNRHNGTVRYLGERWDGERLQAAMALCDVMALVHNSESDAGQLWLGGYGALGILHRQLRSVATGDRGALRAVSGVVGVGSGVNACSSAARTSKRTPHSLQSTGRPWRRTGAPLRSSPMTATCLAQRRIMRAAAFCGVSPTAAPSPWSISSATWPHSPELAALESTALDNGSDHLRAMTFGEGALKTVVVHPRHFHPLHQSSGPGTVPVGQRKQEGASRISDLSKRTQRDRGRQRSW